MGRADTGAETVDLAPDEVQALDAHQRLRGLGIAAVSTLVGPMGSALAAARRWARATGRGVCSSRAQKLDDLAEDFGRELGRLRDLRKLALTRVSRWTGLEFGVLENTFARPSRERALLARGLVEHGPCGELCAAVLEGPPRLVSAFAWEGAPSEPCARLGALIELVSAEPLPLLLVPFDADVAMERHRAIVGALVRLAEHLPNVPVVVAMDDEVWRGIEEAPDAHAKSVLATGLIRVARVTTELRVPGEFAPSVRALDRAGASREVWALFERAAEVAGAAPRDGDGVERGRARSAAEAFLFSVLEECPSTAGCFELNGKRSTRDGRAVMEIDLVSDPLRLAIEIDGHYHFLNDEAYRRDRRKDLNLQRAGYFVARFLAEDVVSDIEQILKTITELVRDRQEVSKSCP